MFVAKGRELIYNSPEAHHSGVILSKLCQQYTEGRNCDLEIRLNETKIFVHKCLIEVFFTKAGAELEKDMFYLDMRRYDTDVVLPLIDMIYSGELRARPEKVYQVLQVATEVGFQEAITGSKLYMSLRDKGPTFTESGVAVKEEPMEVQSTQNTDVVSDHNPRSGYPYTSSYYSTLCKDSNLYEDKEPSKNVYEVLKVDQTSKSHLLQGRADIRQFLATSAASSSEANLAIIESSIGKKHKRIDFKNLIDEKANMGNVQTILVKPPKEYEGKVLSLTGQRPRRKFLQSLVTKTVYAKSFPADNSSCDTSDTKDGATTKAKTSPKRKQKSGERKSKKKTSKSSFKDSKKIKADLKRKCFASLVNETSAPKRKFQDGKSEEDSSQQEAGCLQSEEQLPSITDPHKDQYCSDVAKKFHTKSASLASDCSDAADVSCPDSDTHTQQKEKVQDGESNRHVLQEAGCSQREATFSTKKSVETKSSDRRGSRLRNKERVNYNMDDAYEQITLNRSAHKSTKTPSKDDCVKTKSGTNKDKLVTSESSKEASNSNTSISARKTMRDSEAWTEEFMPRVSESGYKLVPASATVPKGCKSSYARPCFLKTRYVTETVNTSNGNMHVVTREVPISTTKFRKFLPDKSRDPQVIVVCHPTKPVVKL